MTTWLPTDSRHVAAEKGERGALKRSMRGALHRLREVLAICARARVAAHQYEELKPLS